MPAEAAGCRLTPSPLTRPLGFTAAAECTVRGTVEGYSDVEDLASQALLLLEEALGATGFEAEPGPLWEYIGGTYNLYHYDLRLAGEGREAGILRVVEAAGTPLAATAALRPTATPEPLTGPLVVGEEPPKPPVLLREPAPTARGRAPLPGQVEVAKPIVYALEGVQRVDPETWRLRVTWRGETLLELGLGGLEERSMEIEAAMHCVTGWSTGARRHRGVWLRDLLREAGAPNTPWLAAVSTRGYAAVLPTSYVDEAFIAVAVEGEPLPRDHGAPARLHAPSLYGWKHTKWLAEIRLLDTYQDGVWEALAYHERGLAARNERFKIRNPEVARRGRIEGEPRPLPPPRG